MHILYVLHFGLDFFKPFFLKLIKNNISASPKMSKALLSVENCATPHEHLIYSILCHFNQPIPVGSFHILTDLGTHICLSELPLNHQTTRKSFKDLYYIENAILD